MKRMNRISRFAGLAMLASCMVENEAAAGEQTGAAEVQKVGTVARKPIINGRMPVAIVALARFGNTKDDATKVQADKFGTTVGKIDDIKKNRNFAYVTKDFAPTAQQKADGVAWLKTHPDYDKQNVDALVVELESIPEASTEQAAAFEAVRVAARGQSPVTKTGEPAAAGGGNRRGSKKEKAPATVPEGATGDALLA